jgi:rhodanese-related sulfurtransferase
MGVPATAQLKSGGLHGPTPNQLPGGSLITTPELVQLLQDPAQGALVFDVLGGPQMLPNAIPVVPASQGGSFDDNVQRDFGQYLQQVTQGRKDRPMVFYCQSSQCWMSYNAALRATRLGYTRVLWYRGGIEAWQQAGGPLVPPPGMGAGAQR